MVVQDDTSGTMKVGGTTSDPGYVPPFLQQFQKDKETVQLNPKVITCHNLQLII